MTSPEIGTRRPRRSVIVGASWAVVGACVLAAILAPIVSPAPPNKQMLLDRLQPPFSPHHLLGTDALGRDVLSRLLYGAQMSLFIGTVTVIITAVVGVVIGLISGYVGGKTDVVIMRVVDVWLAFPFLLLAIALAAALGRGPDKMILALVLAGWPGIARPVRSEALQLREREYALSARVLGVTRWGIMFKHLLPNILPTIIVLAALDLGSTILSLASLSFLGLGLDPETATWGGMLSDGRAYVSSAWWLATLPGVAIFAVVMAVNLIGDSLRDRFDPRSPFRRGRAVVLPQTQLVTAKVQ